MLFPKFNRPKRHSDAPKKELSVEAKKRFWLVIIMTIVLFAIYYGSPVFLPELELVVMVIYMVAFAGLLISYFIYNRGFVNKDVTEDMLPDTWSQEKKTAFLEGERMRTEKSRWMLVLIIPFAMVFMAEALYLFVWEGWLGNFLKG